MLTTNKHNQVIEDTDMNERMNKDFNLTCGATVLKDVKFLN